MQRNEGVKLQAVLHADKQKMATCWDALRVWVAGLHGGHLRASAG